MNPKLMFLLVAGAIAISSESKAFYNAQAGLWISRDSVNEPGFQFSFRKSGVNIAEEMTLYCFVHNNPVNTIDSLGLKKIYGNWCGPDWTGGNKGEYDPNGGPYLPPIDGLDSACQTHDICYFNCRQRFPCNPNGRSTCFRDCDRALTTAAYAFGGVWGKTIGAAIDRPGTRDPGPNKPCCNTPPPPPPPSRPPIIWGGM